MNMFGGSAGFPLQHEPILEIWLHDRFRKAAWLVFIGCWIWALLPQTSAHTRRKDRVLLMLLVLLNLVLINGLKHFSSTSCPWSVQNWGEIADYVSHWRWGLADGGPGRCFPGGHASAAWAFAPLLLAAWWPLGDKPRHPKALIISGFFLLGVLLTAVTQTLRGAHYPSHTLWTAVICSGVSLIAWMWWQDRTTRMSR